MRGGSAGDGVLLHGFEQRALRLGRGAIDFVRQHQVREDRPGLKAQGLGAVLGIDDHAADDVGGHQVGRELDARILQVQHARQRAQQRGLAQAGNAFEQDVSARQQADEYAIDDFLLADDDLANFGSNFVELGGGKFKGCVRLHAIYSTSGSSGGICNDSRSRGTYLDPEVQP